MNNRPTVSTCLECNQEYPPAVALLHLGDKISTDVYSTQSYSLPICWLPVSFLWHIYHFDTNIVDGDCSVCILAWAWLLLIIDMLCMKHSWTGVHLAQACPAMLCIPVLFLSDIVSIDLAKHLLWTKLLSTRNMWKLLQAVSMILAHNVIGVAIGRGLRYWLGYSHKTWIFRISRSFPAAISVIPRGTLRRWRNAQYP